MEMRSEPATRSNDVIIHDPETAEAHARRVHEAAKREGMLAVQPADVGSAT